MHASTQMCIHSAEGVRFMARHGFSRVILAREMSLAEVENAARAAHECGISVETFAHGALCMGYSGRCLISSFAGARIGSRSGNRGACAQPCRLQYTLGGKTGHLLSPKDMCTLDILPQLVATGTAALKIEGRMKNADYVYTVTRAYRNALDGIHDAFPSQDDVLQIFNRGGSFSYGHLAPSGDMLSTKSPKSTGVRCGTVVEYARGRVKIRFLRRITPGDGIEIHTTTPPHVGCGINRAYTPNDIATLKMSGGIAVGDAVYKSYDKNLADKVKHERARDTRQQPVQAQLVAKVGEKMRLALQAGGISIEVQSEEEPEQADNAPISPAEITAQLCKTGGTPFEINFTACDIDDNMFVPKQVLNSLRREAISLLEQEIISRLARPALPKKHLGMPALPPPPPQADYTPLPHISHDAADNALREQLPQMEADPAVAGYLVSTHSQLQILHGTAKKPIMLGHSFNVMNVYAQAFFSQFGAVTMSAELGSCETAPHMMITKLCPIGQHGICGSGAAKLTDPSGRTYTVTPDCSTCTAYIS
jgi:putative protease